MLQILIQNPDTQEQLATTSCGISNDDEEDG
ncbi:hypothetical protein ALT761_00921 [Alteromonas sp. 76-1]|nr:hypothetical protein ALT761_00921 [Alteromonas sp. 76-1]